MKGRAGVAGNELYLKCLQMGLFGGQIGFPQPQRWWSMLEEERFLEGVGFADGVEPPEEHDLARVAQH
jgi:hypothetical protein